MDGDLIELIDAFDRVVAMAAETVPAEEVAAAAAVGRRVRNRRGYLGSTVVVALAGGTGSGKSSMVNALAGEEVATTGAMRPTTSEPLAWIPANPEPGAIRLLDDIGVTARVGQDRHDWLAVIDLPDTDSVAVEHRHTVARLIPEVDAVVWVLDPEKYQDRVLHGEHIRPLAAHQDRFLFVLNQVDRLGDGEVEKLVEDLRASLQADGIIDPVIIPTAADPEIGPSEGVDDLVLALRALGDAKEVVTRKLSGDLRQAVDRLSAVSGTAGGRATGFTGQWERLLEEASAGIVDDVLGPVVRSQAGRVGRSTNAAAVSLLRRRVSGGVVELASRAEAGTGALAAVRKLDAYVSGLASRVHGDTSWAVRQVGEAIDEAVAAAVDTVAYTETVPISPPPEWTATVAWVRRIGALALLLGAVWLFDTWRSGAGLLLPLSVTIGGLLGVVLPRVAVTASGSRRAASLVDERRGALERAVSRELDRRLGRPLRDALRRRAGLAAAVAEFELLAAAEG